MDHRVIEECLSLSLGAKIPFPELIKRLQAQGVERYFCDLVGLKMHYYSTEGKLCTLPLAYKAAPVAPHFDAAAVKKSIVSSQSGQITYVQTLSQIIAAGCCHYVVYITGKKVIYSGREGSQHIEIFPGAKV